MCFFGLFSDLCLSGLTELDSKRWKILNSVFGLMVMGVSAKIRNGFECFCKCNIFVFQIWVKKNSVRRSVLVFGNVSFNIVVRINHDNVASRRAVGRTHTIIRLQTRIRRKDGTEDFGGFVFVLDGFVQRDSVCSFNSSVSFPATTPRATTPHRSLFRLPRLGLPRPTDTLRLPRRGLPLPYRYIQADRLPGLQGYYTRASTLLTNFWVPAGYHTCG